MNYEAIFNEATAAATAAMKTNGRNGMSGFAWVTFNSTRGDFVAWCKAQIQKEIEAAEDPKAAGQIAHRKYGDIASSGNWEISISYSGESLATLVVGSVAFAHVLNLHGIEAYARSMAD
jgi:hypothetical protein